MLGLTFSIFNQDNNLSLTLTKGFESPNYENVDHSLVTTQENKSYMMSVNPPHFGDLLKIFCYYVDKTPVKRKSRQHYISFPNIFAN